MLKDDVYVPPKRFCLNGHTTGFYPQTEEFKPPYKSPSCTLAIKELKVISHVTPSSKFSSV